MRLFETPRLAKQSRIATTGDDIAVERSKTGNAAARPATPFQLFGNSDGGGNGIKRHHSTEVSQFKERYQLGRLLGCGSFSTVRVAVDRATGKKWACKIVTEEAERAVLLREVDIMKQLHHPNLVEYREHFDTPGNLIIITELLEGPDLLGPLLERGSFPEDDAREIIRQLLSALAYLDSKGVAHRDLKMENIMLTTAGDNTKIKIIDFGLADQLSDDKAAFRETCGTPTFIAPEVASGVPYGTKCDVWSAGIILFMLLSGDRPFHGNSVHELMATIRRAKLRFRDPVWEITSFGAKHLVQTLLTANSAVRVTAQEARAHTWLSQ
jgi:serine/threonine protein kinase